MQAGKFLQARAPLAVSLYKVLIGINPHSFGPGNNQLFHAVQHSSSKLK